MTDEKLVPVFMPTLTHWLTHREREKGAPLTEQEVLEIRDSALVMMVRESVAEEMAQERGYRDIDPQNCWLEWQQMREQINMVRSESDS
jgi:hypothetical protein